MRLAGRLNAQTPGLRADAVAAARRIFLSKGYSAATLDEVARRVGLTRPSLLHHFPSKAHLAVAVRVEALERLTQAIAPHRGDAPRAGLARLVGGYLDFVAEHPDAAASLLQSEHLAVPRDAAGALRQAERSFREAVEGWLKRPIREGVFARLPPAAYEPLVLGPAQAYARHWLEARRPKELRQVRAVLVDAAWRAVAGR